MTVTMWGLVVVSVVLRISVVFGQTMTSVSHMENETLSRNTEMSDLAEELKASEFGSFLDEMSDWGSSAMDFIRERTRIQASILQPVEDGRKLKHKKAELKFITKTLLILKVVLGLVLPIGIIASKILSWKAVTLSLMAFMLAKILFVKNLLTGKNAFSVTPTNFVPPVVIQGGLNDALWKRQGDSQAVYPWNST